MVTFLPTRAPGPSPRRSSTTVPAEFQTHVTLRDGQRVCVFEFAQSDNPVRKRQGLIWLPQRLVA